MKRRAMSSEKARKVRADGHIHAVEFAELIGVNSDYKNNPQAKKDVIDLSGDAHSVKSGNKRWQIFLYSKNRIASDSIFNSMNGIGELILNALNLYPPTFEEYKQNKALYKENLRSYMRELKDLLSVKRRCKSFLSKSIFNGGEVNYLTVKHNDKFYIFHNEDVLNVMSENFVIENSLARLPNQTSEQKVLFKFNEKNLGELEIRNSGNNHYCEILFIMNKLKVIDMLFEKINNQQIYNDKVILMGRSIKTFHKKIIKK